MSRNWFYLPSPRRFAWAILVALIVAVGVTAIAGSLGTGSRFSGHYAGITVPTCNDDAYGMAFFTVSTGGSQNGRVLFCTSTQGTSVGYGWRALTLKTALSL